MNLDTSKPLIERIYEEMLKRLKDEPKFNSLTIQKLQEIIDDGDFENKDRIIKAIQYIEGES